MNKDKVKINVINVQQQENKSDCGVFARAVMLKGKIPAECDCIHPKKHLAQYLHTGCLPKFSKVLAEHLPAFLHKEEHIPLKPVEKSLSDYDKDILCLL